MTDTTFVTTAFVSVNQSFDPHQTVAELEFYAAGNWAIGVTKAIEAERVVAVFEGYPVAAWRSRGAYAVDETYIVVDQERPRVAFALADPLPLIPEYRDVPALRRGIAISKVQVSA
jgi:hypothetical protein